MVPPLQGGFPFFMTKSYVDQRTDIMHQLLWDNILREFVRVEMVALPLVIPGVGPLLSGILSTPPIQEIVLFLISRYLEVPLFRLLVRWGVFTSVDWKEDAIYNAYEATATRLLPELGGKPDKDWTPEDEKAFEDAAADLIRLHIPGWGTP